MISHIDVKKCTGCGICVEVCPLDTLRLDPFQETHPPCRQSCPAGVDVRGFLFYLKQGMLEQASVYLHDFLPFPAITGLLCHHPCENACARKKVDQAVNIHGMEHYIGTSPLPAAMGDQNVFHAGKAAVIGSGPAGMSAGYFLRKTGYSVTVFESDRALGGSLLEEVTKKRLPADVLEAQFAAFTKMGISFVPRSKLFVDMNIRDLRDQRYCAIFLATGSGSGFPAEIATDAEKTVRVDPVTSETSVKGIFAGGGVTGERLSLVEVIASARRSAIFIDRFMRKEDLRSEPECSVKKVKKFSRSGIKVRERLEPEGGFTDKTASGEAHRCMSCGALAYVAHPEDCMTCFECEVRCPSQAIKVHPFKEILPMTLVYPTGVKDHG